MKDTGREIWVQKRRQADRVARMETKKVDKSYKRVVCIEGQRIRVRLSTCWSGVQKRVSGQHTSKPVLQNTIERTIAASYSEFMKPYISAYIYITGVGEQSHSNIFTRCCKIFGSARL